MSEESFGNTALGQLLGYAAIFLAFGMAIALITLGVGMSIKGINQNSLPAPTPTPIVQQ